MSSVVLDASAILALVDEEPGADVVLGVLTKAAIGTVNLAEAYSKLAERGRDGVSSVAMICASVEEVLPFTTHLAEIAGSLRPLTRHLGLSLGDRACLALAIALNAEVLTADRTWALLNVGCRVRPIR